MEGFENLQNEDLINHIRLLEGGISNISSDDFLKIFLKSIDIKSASDDFISKLLNNDFKGVDLTKLLQNNFIKFYENLFENFKSQEDFLLIKNWKMSKNINEEILRICIKKISRVLIEEIKSNKDGNISIYPSLILFLCNLFAFSSNKLNNIFDELSNLEKNFPSSKLIEVYFIILYKGERAFPISESFKEHLRDYIENNAGKDALSVWYKLILVDKSGKVDFLDENLKNEYIVKSEHFVGYPLIKNEKVSLFTYLYKDREKYFQKKYIIETNYYKQSIKASTKEEIFKLTYDQAREINNKMKEFYDLFKLFVPIKEYDENNYREYFGILFSELEYFILKFENFDKVLSFFKKYFPFTKKNEIILLSNFQDELKKLPLKDFDEKIKRINEYKEYKEELDKYKEIIKSSIFTEIYDSSQQNFQQEQEKEHFDYSLQEFYKIKELEKDSNIKALDRNNLDILISAAKKNINNLNKELYLIKEIFGIKKDSEKFDVLKISMDLEKLIPKDIKNKKEVQIPKKEKQIKIMENKHLKVLEDKFNDCYNYYKENEKKKEDDKYYEKYVNYFKYLFSDKEILKLDSNEFTDYVIKKMFIIYYSGIIDIPEYSKNESTFKNEIQFIKDLFEIIDVYKSNDNLYQISENIKKIFPSLNNRISEKGNNIFSGLGDLFSSIVENKKEKGELFSLCFINIIIEEIKIKRIQNEQRNILAFIFKYDYLLENCIPLINYYFKDKFFSDLKNKNIKDDTTIYFKESSLALLENNCKNSQILKEKLLYYFETNINQILEEKYPNNEFIQSDVIKTFIKKIRAYFKEDIKDKALNETITLLYFVSFLKVFYTKYITAIENQINLRNNFYDNFLTEENFSLTNSLSYFILKLYLDFDGNFLDFLKSNKIPFPKEVTENIGSIVDKDFGFDYLILPFEEKRADKFNEIYRQIIHCLNDPQKFENDIGIVDDINNNDIDILYCILSNLFLSKLSLDNYSTKEEYNTINKWLNEKLEKNSFTKLNDYSKKIISIIINMKNNDGINLKIEYNKDLINFIFAFRFILNSLSKPNNYFLRKLLLDTNNTIPNHKDIFAYFFSDDKKDKNKNGIGFSIVKFIIFSHLIFAHLLGNISLEQISSITLIKFEENNITKALTSQFKEVQKFLRYYGIKNKYCVIYMNIIFEEIKKKGLNDIINDSNYLNRRLLKIDSEKFKNYFKIISKIGMSQKMGMNDFKKIIFEEDYNYCMNKVVKDSSFIYFTLPNFCDINDFMLQYQYSNFNSELIDSILNHKMDEIINKLNCLPVINSVVNKLYYKYNLMITKNKAMNQNIDLDEELIKKFNEIKPKIKEYFNIDFPNITRDTKLIELINIKDNKIYKIYESFNSTIESFNILLNKYKQEDQIELESKNIQDFSTEDSFNAKTNNLAFEKLLELIQIYSTRNRFDFDVLNVYDGDKIIYDFKLIENILINEFIFKKKLLINSQRSFIFSNEIFSSERNDLIYQLIKKFEINIDEEKIVDGKLLELKNEIDEIDENNKLEGIYSNLQKIMIYIYYYYIKNNAKKINKKLLLKEICQILEEKGYDKMDDKLKNSEIFINYIIYLYEFLEEKLFDNFSDIISNDIKLKPENLKNEKKNELNEYFKNNNLLLTKIILITAFKKYILRYCFCDYEKEDEILNNFNIEKIFNKIDIWNTNILNDQRFKEEKDKLISFNNNDLEQYFLNSILIGEEEEETKNEEEQIDNKEKEEDDKKSVDSKKSDDSKRSDDSKKSDGSKKSDDSKKSEDSKKSDGSKKSNDS